MRSYRLGGEVGRPVNAEAFTLMHTHRAAGVVQRVIRTRNYHDEGGKTSEPRAKILLCGLAFAELLASKDSETSETSAMCTTCKPHPHPNLSAFEHHGLISQVLRHIPGRGPRHLMRLGFLRCLAGELHEVCMDT